VTPDTSELINQHVQLLKQLDTLWQAFTVLIFVMIAMLGFIVALAGYSVSRVNRRQGELISQLAERQTGVEDSWKEVIVLLMKMLRGSKSGNQ
jgi:hypothetical protein